MTDFHAERSLLLCLILNIAIFGSAWRFAKRIAASRSQAALDAVLLAYAIQYISIGLPGIIGCLNLTAVTVVAAICVITLWAISFRSQSPHQPPIPLSDRLWITAASTLAVTIILTFVYRQSDLPVISNDAMTYHFPAAVQWMQQGKISLFQTWFFNPSNTYSPLAGSMFILWLILPLGNDMLARFVEVPPLIGIGLGLYCLCRELKCRPTIAILTATTAVLCRPIFIPCMMAKDDLFVALFLITALVALSRGRSSDRFDTIRLGIALGLLLATKYTAFLSLPILLFAIGAPGWTVKKCLAALLTASLFAGPWYLRNTARFNNPIFPLGSLFTSARSEAFHTIDSSLHIIVGSTYGLPTAIAIALLLGYIGAVTRSRKLPVLRACTYGSLFTIILFVCKSPFPEVRFLLPSFALLFASTGFVIEQLSFQPLIGISIAGLMVALSLTTLFPGLLLSFTVPLIAAALLIAGLVTAAVFWMRDHSLRKLVVAVTATMILLTICYTRWTAYCSYQNETRFLDGAGYSVEYPELTRLWKCVDETIPPDATVAYTNFYFVYPLQGGSLQRKLIYAPTRSAIKSIADLGWLGSNLSGEALVPAAIRATVRAPDRAVWMSNLNRSNASYLVVGTSQQVPMPIEKTFASADPGHFQLIYQSPAGWIYRIITAPTPPDPPASRAAE